MTTKNVYRLYLESKFGRIAVDEFYSLKKALKEYNWYRDRNPDFSFVIVSYTFDSYMRYFK